ncbi:MAG: Acg family FMN-binding oxidoreductase [Phenylobacterium sp.]
MPTRRHIFQLLAAAPVLASAGCSGPAETPDPYAAWRQPGQGESDPRRFVLAHGLLAPNPHNRQPWLVRLEGADAMSLYVDPTRLLPETDPFNRQIVVGCGAFLELIALSAPRLGLVADIQAWPQGIPGSGPRLGDRPFARVVLRPDPAAKAGPLFDQIVRRRTEKAPFLPERPSDAAVREVLAAAAGPGLVAGETRDPGLRDPLAAICWKAWEIESGTPRTHLESVRLMRIGKAEVARNPDGIDLSGGMMEVLARAGVMTREALSDPTSMASRSGVDMYREMIDATPGFFWIRSETADRSAQLAAGRAYARAQLAASANGLVLHPWSMALQEFAEMSGPYRQVQALLGARPDAPVQMLVRMGAVRKASGPSPRRKLDDLILS